MSKEPTGFVYFVVAAFVGLVKIGYAGRDPDDRLASLQTGSPVPLERLAPVRGTRELEQELHKRFADLRTHGEWFQLGQPIKDFILYHGSPWHADPLSNSVGKYARLSRWIKSQFEIGVEEFVLNRTVPSRILKSPIPTIANKARAERNSFDLRALRKELEANASVNANHCTDNENLN